LGDIIDSEFDLNWKMTGRATMQNVKIKPEMFTKVLGLPLEIVYSKIGTIDLDIPILNYASKPVKAHVNDVQIVVRPITDKARWDFTKLLQDPDLSKIEMEINSYVWNKFEELKLSKDEKQKQDDILRTTIEIVLDNIQLKISKIHIRIENPVDLLSSQASFAMGVTMDYLNVFTVDENSYPVDFINRSSPEN